MEKAKVEVYTDGAVSNNGNTNGSGKVTGGTGWLIVEDGEVSLEIWSHYDDTLSSEEPYVTNNQMELMAALEALTYIEENNQEQNVYTDKHIILYSDSAYFINGITTHIQQWKKNGWKTAAKKPVKNQELWKAIDATVANLGSSIEFKHVKGHADNVYQCRADKLAVMGKA